MRPFAFEPGMVRKDLNDFHTRRGERTPLRCAVSFRNRAGRVSYGWSRDVSTRGVYVQTNDRERLGTLCRMRMTIHWGEKTHRLTMHGQVARCDPGGLAFQFVALPAEVRALIEEILYAWLRDEYHPEADGTEAGDAASDVAAPDETSEDGIRTEGGGPDASAGQVPVGARSDGPGDNGAPAA
jgi:hypothetical protein